jgi:hypothetical protein
MYFFLHFDFIIVLTYGKLLRVVFRIVFNLPFLVLGLDGVMGDHGINESPYVCPSLRVGASLIMCRFWSDFLFMLGAIGCFLSSAITLHVSLLTTLSS